VGFGRPGRIDAAYVREAGEAAGVTFMVKEKNQWNNVWRNDGGRAFAKSHNHFRFGR